jgi:hypothetical protein
MVFDDLVAQYGGPRNIPDRDLYDFINREDVRASLQDYGKLGLEKLKELAVVDEVRRRCEQELWFLGKYFLWDTDTVGAGRPIEENFICEHVHRRLFDVFIKKDKTKKIGEQDWRKDRLILYPRGTAKSASDRYDVVQWVLNFPDIRILYLTAEQDLAEGFVKETKNHFLWREDEPSLMNLYFPEYCFTENDSGPADWLTCPLWAVKKIKRKEPTVWGSSITSTLSGKHFEVIKADDSVSDRNSENEEQCNKIADKFNLKRKMLVPTGYSDKIGTRYSDADMYGTDLEKNVGEIKRESGPCWERIDNLTTGLIVLIGRSIVIKPEVAAQLEKDGKPVTYQNAGPEGCDLLFPEYQSYAWCMQEYPKNEKIFEGQQNQNPRSASSVLFDRNLLVRHTIPFEALPDRGPITQTWDFAFSKKKGRDYTTASAVMWDTKGRGYVIDLIRARFTPTALAQAVVDFALKWRPTVIGVEKAAGSDLIGPAVEYAAAKTSRPDIVDLVRRIDWYAPDNQKDAKSIRIASLHPWLVDDRLFFANYLANNGPLSVASMDIIYTEFEKFMTSHHNDIPDVIAQQLRYAPRMAMIVENKESVAGWSSSDPSWNLLFEENADAFGQIREGSPQPQSIISVPEEPEEIIASSPYDTEPNVLGAGLWG